MPETAIPRAEYPRPQFQRPEWLCLNGTWEFEIDQGDSGLERGLLNTTLSSAITVPFAPESELSGIGTDDFLTAVWYRRQVTVPAEWAGQRVVLHFQAVDYDTTVWVDGTEVGRHRGGFTPFSVDITDTCAPGSTAVVTVRARDSATGPQARGKQSQRYRPHGAVYRRTTGIWQTVWLEPVPDTHLQRPRITPDAVEGVFHVQAPISAGRPGLRLRYTVSDDAGEVVAGDVRAGAGLAVQARIDIPADRIRLWSPQDPHLYGIRFELVGQDGDVVDRVDSYAGLRSVSMHGNAILLNGKRVFQRLVLDQGFYPDGVMTAPSDGDLVRDIEISLSAGFNGARLHQKVFEERFLYHADRMGYLVWGEFADWGCNVGGKDGDQRPDMSYVSQWLEALERDYSHPAVIGWCPLNETYQELGDEITLLDDATRALFLATKAYDTSRPVLDTSGYSHRVAGTDVYDSHSYEQDPAAFRAQMAGLDRGEAYTNTGPDGRVWSLPYAGQPYFCSEFGGIWWSPDDVPGPDSWGYGLPPGSEDEWVERFAGLVSALLDDGNMFGYCFTQLTDVYQERNGLYTFERKPKFDIERLRQVQTRVAAFEKSGEYPG
ncbi:glycoside hydrolase family 2 protein [Phytoactinopolyspora endophytica]|uniref:glycoside hydrolase family 2 protein n=1 Tax=Phytoactinopolyspora endophytica TaxID=1642495 RepID=UPI00101C5F81|nr:sugar-binding domain-containing protein [Phytoactinopolyspora endophytica]